MGLEVSPLGSAGFGAAQTRPPRDARASAPLDGRDAAELSSGAIPDSPPPEVLDAIGAAGRVAQELHDQGRELRFVPGEHGERIRIEVRDMDGNVLRTIPPSGLLDLAGGAPIE